MTVLKHLVEAIFSPIGIMTFLFAAGVLARMVWHQSRTGRHLIIGGIALYALFLFTPLAEVLVANLERAYPPLLHADPATGVRNIVVLSGYGEDHPSFPVTSQLSGDTVVRMVEAVRLYRELPGARLIVSGGVLREDDRPVANLMADLGKAMGVPERDVVIEGRSLTTYENLTEVQRIIGATPFLLVTSACDLRRAMAVARKLGMNPLAAPAGYWAAQKYPPGLSWREWLRNLSSGFLKPSMKRLIYLQWAYHEYAGYLWYRALGRI